MEEEAKNLNYEFNYNIYMINSMKDRNFKLQNDRNKIVLWIKKLRQCNLSFEDMILRNEFLYFLLTCVKNGELRPPFTEVPPSEPIAKLRNLLPSGSTEKSGINTDWVEDLEKADSSIPDIYRKSPDGGQFFSQQPIPKCGAFCYLAILPDRNMVQFNKGQEFDMPALGYRQRVPKVNRTQTVTTTEANNLHRVRLRYNCDFIIK